MKNNLKIVCVTNYPPRQCGIATFSENLTNAILKAAEISGNGLELEIIAMNDSDKTYPYPDVVKNVIRCHVKDDYIQMADYINSSGATLCLLEHEFGIFGGESGVLLLALLRRIKIPIVSTFHTVLQKPNFHQHEVLCKIAAYSTRIVVMNGLAINFLVDIYKVRREKIVQIEHGVPDYEAYKHQLLPAPLLWKDRKVMLTFGLIGRSKGIETAIRSLPLIIANHPEVLYVVLGKTHPNILHVAGEEYRTSLNSLVKQLNLEKNVLFINEYVSEIELMSYLKAADIYITPYLNKAQITSGTLSYAVSGGCAVVSTPYWHAEELLADGRGCLFDFGNYCHLATMVNKLLDNPLLLREIQQRAYNYGRSVSWPLIGKAYLNLFNIAVAEVNRIPNTNNPDLSIHYPDFDISYLRRLTDDTALLQHARACIPNYKDGYCLDDNARAIIVCLAAWNRSDNLVPLDLLTKYLAFLTYMQQEDGSFKNYMTYERIILDDISDDAFGRVFWALGYLIGNAPNHSFLQLGLELLEHSLPQLKNLTYARGYANCILGLYYYVKRFPDQERFINLMKVLSDQLCEKYDLHKRENWNWFEDQLTYDNGLLPSALYRVYEITGSERYLQIADESRIFLESKCFASDWLSLVGNRNWLKLGSPSDPFAQQPIDAMAMVLLYESAWQATGDDNFIQKIRLCFDWFFGKNDMNISLLDSDTKGCKDGIEEFNINQNQGAESNIAYLLSWLITEPFFQ